MLTTHAVGIDLGTTYSCVAYLNERGEPVTIPNHEGELCTPSVVMYEDGEEVVGTEALRNAIMFPRNVVQNAKRFMGDQYTHWVMNGQQLSPIDISAAILRKLLRDAGRQIGKIERAVITVPAQFSDLQRQATVQAGLKAGLKHVDIINEPVAASLCYVLGKEGLWFTELAEEQRILVYDLGGGTFDLSLVRYHKDEVSVIASSGDLHLGGIDFNELLLNAVAEQFIREFKDDPRKELESLQALTWEVEQCKRSLTTRPRAALICQHAGKRKTYQIEQAQFNQLTEPLVDKSEEITRKILIDNKLGWAHVDVVLITGGSSRMPMIRNMLQRVSGRTLNTSLSPDQAIAHGAAYYSGMLLTNTDFAKSILNEEATARLAKVKQKSVNARGLGILVRDVKTNLRVPHYMIPANTPLPTSITHTFGTVVPNQQRVMLRIVESGANANKPFVEIGDCAIEGLPENLPVDSHIAVTISYDSSAKIHVSAKDVTSGKEATTQIHREENLVSTPAEEEPALAEVDDTEVTLMPADAAFIKVATTSSSGSAPQPQAAKTPPKPIPVPSTPAAPQTTKIPPPAKPAPPMAEPAKVEPAKPAPVIVAGNANAGSANGGKSTFQPVATPAAKPAVKATPKPVPITNPARAAAEKLDESAVPVLLCNDCGEPLSRNGTCTACGKSAKPPTAKPGAAKPVVQSKPGAPKPPTAQPVAQSAKPVAQPTVKAAKPTVAPPAPKQRPPVPPPNQSGTNLSRVFEPDEHEIMELPDSKPTAPKPAAKPAPKPAKKPPEDAETDFWALPET